MRSIVLSGDCRSEARNKTNFQLRFPVIFHLLDRKEGHVFFARFEREMAEVLAS